MKHLEIKFRSGKIENIDCDNFVFEGQNRMLIISYVNVANQDYYNVDAIQSIKVLEKGNMTEK